MGFNLAQISLLSQPALPALPICPLPCYTPAHNVNSGLMPPSEAPQPQRPEIRLFLHILTLTVAPSLEETLAFRLLQGQFSASRRSPPALGLWSSH